MEEVGLSVNEMDRIKENIRLRNPDSSFQTIIHVLEK